jgi:hypothetical protein
MLAGAQRSCGKYPDTALKFEPLARNAAQALRTSRIVSAFIADSRRWAISGKSPFGRRSRVLMLSLSRNPDRFFRGGASVNIDGRKFGSQEHNIT